jgi:hypothetical protein
MPKKLGRPPSGQPPKGHKFNLSLTEEDRHTLTMLSARLTIDTGQPQSTHDALRELIRRERIRQASKSAG